VKKGNSWPPAKLRKKADRVCLLLMERYGTRVSVRRLPPIDELVMTILSQNTNDVNMLRAYKSLEENYESWEEVLEAPQEELAEVIRTSGMFRMKAKRIQATLGEIQERVGELDLSLLETLDDEEAMKWLTSLYGVGPKTAAIVLLFSLGRAVLPVDTHVWRVSKRLGLIDDDVSRERAHILLQELIDDGCIPSLNNNLVRHGREICRAQNPICSDCFLNRLCKFHSTFVRQEKTP
jgi:endonuclease-3